MNGTHVPAHLLHHLMVDATERTPQALALVQGEHCRTYAQLHAEVHQFAAGLLALGLQRNERVAIFLEKRVETVVASFGATAAGGVMVPVNPLLKPEQVGYVLRDSNVRVLVTSPERWALLTEVLDRCPDLRQVVLVPSSNPVAEGAQPAHYTVEPWRHLQSAPARAGHRVIDSDMAAILYTSGSTGSPKGVVLSHRNLVVGAHSVNAYLHNTASDTLLAVLPLSFDAGFSQLTTAFAVGARVVLLNYLLPRDVLKALHTHRVTGLTAVPPLYMQLVQQAWPEGCADTLRYFANTGGRMPRETLRQLRVRAPRAQPFLMYGLTEAFRSTYLPPDQVDQRPDSIGQAIPNAEVLVLRPDGSECGADEPGELVHRGPLVGMGYWNNPQQTAERFKPLADTTPGRPVGLQLPEYAVFSGDTVRRDAEGYIYFVGRKDEMIKTSGYRVSPTEVEEALYATGQVTECVAFGVEHPTLGQTIQVLAYGGPGRASVEVQGALLDACKAHLPAYMVPAGIRVVEHPLPRNPNGKLDRKALQAAWIADNAGHP